ncbi:MAG: hypothetical protein Q7S51_07110 [Gallionellaceae bacterium]|nr:hypothetical protein [Gallionellaceae bacterium]
MMKKLINVALTSQIPAISVASFKKSVPLFLGLIFLSATVSSWGLTIPESDEDYPGASLAFVAMEPYRLFINGSYFTYEALANTARANDFSGKVSFINPRTNKADPAQFIYNGTILNADYITASGVAGRVEKKINQAGENVTMVRYQANDATTAGACRTQVNSFAVPPRTHVRWDLKVAFGANETGNTWNLTTSGISPVLFWELKSTAPANPPLAAIVDTDSQDPSKLMIFFSLKVGNAPSPIRIAEVHNLSRYTQIPIVIEAFLDERPTPADGGVGKGTLKIWVNNLLITDMATPTLLTTLNEGGSLPTHYWSMGMYLYNATLPYPSTRASFWKTAKMIVFPKPD